MSKMTCPRCDSENIVRNGNTAYGKRKYMCKDCRKYFIENPDDRIISDEKKELIDKLLLEKIPLAGIARVVGVSLSWLYGYRDEKYKSSEKKPKVSEKEKGPLTIRCDEMCSFVGEKKNKVWIWLAIDADTREIVGAHVGGRGRKDAESLWGTIPPVYRQYAVIYTDFWHAYNGVLPPTRHKAVPKESGKTSYIERFNNTMRQRVSRLVRKTLSFSKNMENLIGAVWFFIHHYNSLIKN
jgi:IS1 family transposase/transposase-like protein